MPKPKPLDRYAAELLAARIKAVADPNRLRMLAAIAARPGIAVYEVRDVLGDVAHSTVSHHLSLLKAAGLVGVRAVRTGRSTVMSITVSRDGLQALSGAIRRLR